MSQLTRANNYDVLLYGSGGYLLRKQKTVQATFWLLYHSHMASTASHYHNNRSLQSSSTMLKASINLRSQITTGNVTLLTQRHQQACKYQKGTSSIMRPEEATESLCKKLGALAKMRVRTPSRIHTIYQTSVPPTHTTSIRATHDTRR